MHSYDGSSKTGDCYSQILSPNPEDYLDVEDVEDVDGI